MAKTTYTVTQVPGSKRTSERPYTHAVIARHNVALERARAKARGEEFTVAWIDETYGAVQISEPYVAQWSMSAANAAKAAQTLRGRQHLCDVQVVECTPLTKDAGVVVTLTADELARKYVTGMESLADLVNRQVIHNYRPTIRLDNDLPKQELAERRALANAYNAMAKDLGIEPCAH